MPDLAELNLRVSTGSVRRAVVDLTALEGASNRANLAAAALLTTLGGFVAKALIEFARFEQAEITVRSLIGSLEESDAIMAQLRAKASSTPFGLTLQTNQVQTMKALGTETKNLIPDLEVMLDTMSAIGGPLAQENLRRFAFQVGEIRGQGKLDAEDLRRLADIKIPAVPILTEALQRTIPGATSGMLRSMIRKGQIDSDSALDALFAGLRERYEGAVELLANSLKGQFDILKNNVQLVLIDLGEQIDDAFDLTGVLRRSSAAIKRFGASLHDAFEALVDGTPLRDLDDDARRIAQTFKVILGGASSLITLNIIGWLHRTTLAIKALTVSLFSNPFTLVATAASLAVGWIIANWKETVTLRNTTLEVGDVVLGVWDAIRDRAIATAQIVAFMWREYAFPEMARLWQEFRERVSVVFTDLIEWSKRTMPGVVDTFKSGLNKIIGMFVGLGEAWDNVWDQMAVSAVLLWDDIKRIFYFDPIELKIGDASLFKMTSNVDVLSDAERRFLVAEETRLLDRVDSVFKRTTNRDYIGDFADDVKDAAAALRQFLEEQAKIDPVFRTLLDNFNAAFANGVLPDIDEILRRATERARAREEQERASAVAAAAGEPSIGGDKSTQGLGIKAGLGDNEFTEYLKALEHEQYLLGLNEAGRTRANRMLEGQAKILEVYGNDAVAAAEALELLRLRVDELADRELFVGVLDTLEQGVRNAFVDGITAAAFNEDWKEALRFALMDVAKNAMSQGINFGLDALLGSDAQGNQNSLAGWLGLAGNITSTAVTGAPANAGAEALGAAGGPGKIDVAVFSVPDEATANQMAAKVTASGAKAIVAKGTGSPGVSAGTVRAGRRGR